MFGAAARLLCERFTNDSQKNLKKFIKINGKFLYNFGFEKGRVKTQEPSPPPSKYVTALMYARQYAGANLKGMRNKYKIKSILQIIFQLLKRNVHVLNSDPNEVILVLLW